MLIFFSALSAVVKAPCRSLVMVSYLFFDKYSASQANKTQASRRAESVREDECVVCWSRSEIVKTLFMFFEFENFCRDNLVYFDGFYFYN